MWETRLLEPPYACSAHLSTLYSNAEPPLEDGAPRQVPWKSVITRSRCLSWSCRDQRSRPPLQSLSGLHRHLDWETPVPRGVTWLKFRVRVREPFIKVDAFALDAACMDSNSSRLFFSYKDRHNFMNGFSSYFRVKRRQCKGFKLFSMCVSSCFQVVLRSVSMWFHWRFLNECESHSEDIFKIYSRYVQDMFKIRFLSECESHSEDFIVYHRHQFLFTFLKSVRKMEFQPQQHIQFELL